MRRDSSTLQEHDPTHLFDEYKTIQDKIDKIGAFRFTIRGWAITVASGAVAASFTTTALVPWLSAVLIPAFVMFWAVEESEIRVRRVLVARALRIERRLGATAPRIASTIVDDQLRLKSLRPRLANFINDQFYIVLSVLLVTVAVIRSFALVSHFWRALINSCG